MLLLRSKLALRMEICRRALLISLLLQRLIRACIRLSSLLGQARLFVIRAVVGSCGLCPRALAGLGCRLEQHVILVKEVAHPRSRVARQCIALVVVLDANTQ